MSYREEKKRVYGQIILELREKNNMTQTQLADKLNINSNAISKWENGMTLPNEENILKLNKIFNVSIDDIYNNNSKDNKLNIRECVLEFVNKYFSILLTFLIIFLVLFILLFIFYINNNGKFNYYSIEKTNQEYSINGSIVEMPDRLNISLSNIVSNTSKISSSNYETAIYLDKILLYRVGDITDTKDENISLNEYLQDISINLSDELILSKNVDLDGKQLIIKINYKSDDEIKTAEMKFLIKKVFSNNKLFY